MDHSEITNIAVGLNAVVVAWDEKSEDLAPKLLIVEKQQSKKELPFGPFNPAIHRTLQEGLRNWVEDLTKLELGYVEQLYTFGNRGRDPAEDEGGPRFMSVSYLALVRDMGTDEQNIWKDWYHFFPWEDWRDGKPPIMDHLLKALASWAELGETKQACQNRHDRIEQVFSDQLKNWNEELVHDRYELLYEAGLIEESKRDGFGGDEILPSLSMNFDHRRILATGMGRLRSKIKYRPVVFELMPPSFTLLQLQQLVEALSGKRLHKQNFRRLLERTGMIEETGEMSSLTGGRPAKLFKFRSEVMAERKVDNMRFPTLPASMR